MPLLHLLAMANRPKKPQAPPPRTPFLQGSPNLADLQTAKPELADHLIGELGSVPRRRGLGSAPAAGGPRKHPIERAVDMIEVDAQTGRPSRDQIDNMRVAWIDSPEREAAYDVIALAILERGHPLPMTREQLERVVDAVLARADLSTDLTASVDPEEMRNQLRIALMQGDTLSLASDRSLAEASSSDELLVIVDPDGKTDSNGNPRDSGTIECDFVPPVGHRARKRIGHATLMLLRGLASGRPARWDDLKTTDSRPQRLVSLLSKVGADASVEGRGAQRIVRCATAIVVLDRREPRDRAKALDRVVNKGERETRARGL